MPPNKTSTNLNDIRELREVGARNDRRLEVIAVEVQLTRASRQSVWNSVETTPRAEHRQARRLTETRHRAPGRDVTQRCRCYGNHDAHNYAVHRLNEMLIAFSTSAVEGTHFRAPYIDKRLSLNLLTDWQTVTVSRVQPGSDFTSVPVTLHLS